MNANSDIDEIPEVEAQKFNLANSTAATFATKLISLEELERDSGTFQIPENLANIPNIALLASSVKPIDQVKELDEEWNYDNLHTEIKEIVRSQYGEYYQK